MIDGTDIVIELQPDSGPQLRLRVLKYFAERWPNLIAEGYGDDKPVTAAPGWLKPLSHRNEVFLYPDHTVYAVWEEGETEGQMVQLLWEADALTLVFGDVDTQIVEEVQHICACLHP